MASPIFVAFARRVVLDPPAKLRIVTLLTSVMLYGATGYVYFESDAKPDLHLADGFWWALVTMTTIGYGDHFPSTPQGRFLVGVPIMIFGVGMLGYALSLASAALIEAKNKELRGMSTIRAKKHVVIINIPSVPKVCRLLDELRHPDALGPDVDVVLVDEETEELPAELQDRRVRFVRGNPARDQTLQRASIAEAEQAIVLAPRPGDPHSDHQVLAVTLAIESSYPGVHTVVECVEEATQDLLRKAGCDRVVCIARFDTSFLSGEALYPGSQEVIEDLLSNDGQQLFISPPGAVSAATFAAAATAVATRGHIAIGIRRGEKTLLNPTSTTPLEARDQLISIGATRL